MSINHGIYREIPLSYDYQGGRTDVEFKLTAIELDGEQEEYHTEDVSNGIRIYIGSKNSYVESGYHTYTIKYICDYVLNLSSNKYDELYWNINGTGWIFTIDTLTAEIILPNGAKALGTKGYTGIQGASGSDYDSKTEGNSVFFSTNRALNAGENLTIAVSWNKNLISYPTQQEQWIHWFKTHALWVICILGLLFLVVKNFFTWMKYGRDPKPGTIMPQYEGPEGISPAEAYIILHEGKTKITAFTAQLIALGEKGHLKIEVSGSKGSRTYSFTKMESTTPLLAMEAELLNDLFSSSSEHVSFQEGSYDPKIKTDMDQLFAAITQLHGEKYRLMRNVLKAKQYIPFLIFGGAALICKWLYGGHWGILIGYAVASIAINLVYGYLYEQPTAEGRKMLDYLEGYKMYMMYADKQRIKFNNPPTMNFTHYEKNLPFAIALGVSNEWGKQFDPKIIEQGFQGHYGGNLWLMAAMMHTSHGFDFDGLSNTISSASIPPSSSGSSGSSFGGGFSGGGGGGGGGGGW